jgi:hypothetical protein
LALKQDQQPARQRFGGFGQPEQANDPPGDSDGFAAACRSNSHTDPAVLQFQRNRLLDQTFSG